MPRSRALAAAPELSPLVEPRHAPFADATRSEPVAARWHLPELAGRLIELCGSCASASLSLAFRTVLDAQCRGEFVAWIHTREASFFPPDVADGGVDLDALAVVRVPQLLDLPLAADVLARSGAFGLIVLELGAHSRIPMWMLTRLSGLARKHGTAILFLTEKQRDATSLGSLISLRADARRTREADGSFACELRVSKDKRRAAEWIHVEVCRGPAGLH